MKKRRNNTRKMLARLTLSVAKTGAGLASVLGFHQPKVPKRLAK